jgi:hypothetical protein
MSRLVGDSMSSASAGETRLESIHGSLWRVPDLELRLIRCQPSVAMTSRNKAAPATASA